MLLFAAFSYELRQIFDTPFPQVSNGKVMLTNDVVARMRNDLNFN